MELAPIILFVYNRPWHTEQTLNALMANELASESILYVYADGPKTAATKSDLEKITEVRRVIRSKKWCKEVHILESDENKGLADSIITGVTDVVNRYGKIIVLEDDIVSSKVFLKFMNEALVIYENEESVMHISGYMYPNKNKLPQTFFFNVPLCWGWATWKRSWRHFNNNSVELLDYLESNRLWNDFNKFGGTFLEQQLRENVSGKINTWFIKWHACVLMRNGLTLYPARSFVNNIGFDSSGVHNGTSDAFDIKEFPKCISVRKKRLKELKKAQQIFVDFYHPSPMRRVNHRILNQPKRFFKRVLKRILKGSVLELVKADSEFKAIINSHPLFNNHVAEQQTLVNSKINLTSNLFEPYFIVDSEVGRYTYIAKNSQVNMASIGSFCSIGPNFFCGFGIHPTVGISTSPMFYSTMKQNGMTLSETDKVIERKRITIGNDVFIGMNVSVLDGVTIGDGAVIGAGAVVSKDIPPYAIAIGNPIKILRYRFNDEQIEKLLEIKWWNFKDDCLKEVEKYFFDVETFIQQHYA